MTNTEAVGASADEEIPTSVKDHSTLIDLAGHTTRLKEPYESACFDRTGKRHILGRNQRGHFDSEERLVGIHFHHTTLGIEAYLALPEPKPTE